MGRVGRIAALACLMAVSSAPSALAQPGSYGTEDGYGGDGIGWGPAYRPDTTFRPARGFYGGVERPNPYLAGGDTTGSIGDPVIETVRPRRHKRVRAVSGRHRAARAMPAR